MTYRFKSCVVIAGLCLTSACMAQDKTPINDTPPSELACGDRSWEGLVGQDAEGLNHGILPKRTRIIRPLSAITMDHLPNRLNLVTDAEGVITRTYCG